MSAGDPRSGFRFAEIAELDLCTGDFVAVVPQGLATKDELLAALAAELRLPAYFGANWDALADCLSDLGWITAHRVLLVHTDLPLADPDERAVYLDALRDAVEGWKDDAARVLQVVFPPGTQLPS